MIKCKSDMIRTEHYHYILDAGENILLPIKARRNEVIMVHSVCIYNNSGANYADCYKIMKTKGHLCRLNSTTAINAGVVQRWATDVYLVDGEECGIAITPDAEGDTCCVNFQIIRMKDEDYFKAT